ncbi:MAG: hypothetical protein ABI185_10235 [Ginsengibacter sp.]
MKIFTLFFFILSVLVFNSSCKKNSSNPTGNLNIANISGNYSGGTLIWQYGNTNSGLITSSGTDPNFTFNITYINPDNITLTINTIAPISPKTFELPLTFKNEFPNYEIYEFSNTNVNGDTLSISVEIDLFSSQYQSQTNASITFSDYIIRRQRLKDLAAKGG